MRTEITAILWICDGDGCGDQRMEEHDVLPYGWVERGDRTYCYKCEIPEDEEAKERKG